MANAPTYKKSKSGMYRVALTACFEHAGFDYKPSAERIVVNEDILEAMIAAGVVDSVAAA